MAVAKPVAGAVAGAAAGAAGGVPVADAAAAGGVPVADAAAAGGVPVADAGAPAAPPAPAGAPPALSLYGLADDSIVDGPGIRLAIFTQGCRQGCLGCHNPAAQPFEGGKPTTTEELWETVEGNPLLAGVTLTGGEPFEQAAALVDFARHVRARGLNVWAYSGYRFEELLAGGPDGAGALLLAQTDVLVDGPYVEELKSFGLRWRGSSNQRLIDVPASLAAGHAVELTGI